MTDDLDRGSLDSDPVAFADQLVDLHGDGPWLDALVERLTHRATTTRNGNDLLHIINAWGMSQSEFAGLLGVSRQAITKWIDKGLPAERAVTIGDLAAATDLLVRHLKLDRIPAVVRRPAPALDGRSLVDLVAAGDTGAVVRATRQMFDPAAVHA